MQRKTFNALLVIVVLLSITGCSDKKEQAAPVYKISAIISGYKWNHNDVTSTLIVDTNHAASFLDISASSGGKTIFIEFQNNGNGSRISAGTYSYPDAYFRYSVTSGPIYKTNSGSITISGVNETAHTFSGTFEFTEEDVDNSSNKVYVTYGKLVDVSYSVTYH